MGRIVLDKVTKSFGETQVIPPLNLTIEESEFAVFVGPSVCGFTNKKYKSKIIYD